MASLLGPSDLYLRDAFGVFFIPAQFFPTLKFEDGTFQVLTHSSNAGGETQYTDVSALEKMEVISEDEAHKSAPVLFAYLKRLDDEQDGREAEEDSRYECANCGRGDHPTSECPTPEVPDAEVRPETDGPRYTLAEIFAAIDKTYDTSGPGLVDVLNGTVSEDELGDTLLRFVKIELSEVMGANTDGLYDDREIAGAIEAMQRGKRDLQGVAAALQTLLEV